MGAFLFSFASPRACIFFSFHASSYTRRPSGACCSHALFSVYRRVACGGGRRASLFALVTTPSLHGMFFTLLFFVFFSRPASSVRFFFTSSAFLVCPGATSHFMPEYMGVLKRIPRGWVPPPLPPGSNLNRSQKKRRRLKFKHAWDSILATGFHHYELGPEATAATMEDRIFYSRRAGANTAAENEENTIWKDPRECRFHHTKEEPVLATSEGRFVFLRGPRGFDTEATWELFGGMSKYMYNNCWRRGSKEHPISALATPRDASYCYIGERARCAHVCVCVRVCISLSPYAPHFSPFYIIIILNFSLTFFFFVQGTQSRGIRIEGRSRPGRAAPDGESPRKPGSSSGRGERGSSTSAPKRRRPWGVSFTLGLPRSSSSSTI